MTSISPAALASTSFIQGQVLSMIHSYTCLAGQPPTEAEVEWYFADFSGPSIENILEHLEKCKFIRHKSNTARTVELVIDPEGLPTLQPGRALKVFNRDLYSLEG